MAYDPPPSLRQIGSSRQPENLPPVQPNRYNSSDHTYTPQSTGLAVASRPTTSPPATQSTPYSTQVSYNMTFPQSTSSMYQATQPQNAPHPSGPFLAPSQRSPAYNLAGVNSMQALAFRPISRTASVPNATTQPSKSIGATIFQAPAAALREPIQRTISDPDKLTHSSRNPRIPVSRHTGQPARRSAAKYALETREEDEVYTAVEQVQTDDMSGFVESAVQGPPKPGSAAEKPPWKTILKMVIHLPRQRFITRMAKLDTGSAVNVMSESVVEDLNMRMDRYFGPDIRPLGNARHRPLGQLTLYWNVLGRGLKTYKTTFLVLDKNSTKGFDALLSEDTIRDLELYIVNTAVWLTTKASEHDL